MGLRDFLFGESEEGEEIEPILRRCKYCGAPLPVIGHYKHFRCENCGGFN